MNITKKMFRSDSQFVDESLSNDLQKQQQSDRKREFTCDDVQSDLRGIKDLATLINSAIISDKIEEIDDIIRQIQVKNSDQPQNNPSNIIQTPSAILQNVPVPKPSTQTKGQVQTAKASLSQHVQQQQQTHKQLPSKKIQSKIEKPNEIKEEQTELTQIKNMDTFLEYMFVRVDTSMKATTDLQAMVKIHSMESDSFQIKKKSVVPEKQNNGKNEMGQGQEESDLKNFECQKKFDKNRDDIVQSQKRIHDMQNQRLVNKITSLYKELQEKVVFIEEKEKDYMHLNKKVQTYFGILSLDFQYEDNDERIQKQLQTELHISKNSSKETQQYRKGYFLFDSKDLLIVEVIIHSFLSFTLLFHPSTLNILIQRLFLIFWVKNMRNAQQNKRDIYLILQKSLNLKDENQKEYRFPYESLSNVKYKVNNDRMMELTWNLQECHEQLNIRFQNDEEMNKFDMQLYLLTLNNTLFQNNSFTGYFDSIKYPYLTSPYQNEERKQMISRFEKKNLGQSMNGVIFPRQDGSQNQHVYNSLMTLNEHEVRPIVNTNLKNQIASSLNQPLLQNSVYDEGIKKFNQVNNNGADHSEIQESHILGNVNHKKNRSFHPIDEQKQSQDGTSTSQNNRMIQSGIFRCSEGLMSYEQMRDLGFWERQIAKYVNSEQQIVQLKKKDPLKEIFALHVEKIGSKSREVFEEEISKLKVSITIDNKPNKIIVEGSKGQTIDIITYDRTKNEYFCELLKFFCHQNHEKSKSIQKAISDLENGMIFLKYSKQSLSPHEKLFFYRCVGDPQRDQLVSKIPSESNQSKYKITLFSDIKSTSLKWNEGPGLIKFQKSDPRIIDDLSLILFLYSGKTIEIIAKSKAQRDQFYNYIQLIREIAKLR